MLRLLAEERGSEVGRFQVGLVDDFIGRLQFEKEKNKINKIRNTKVEKKKKEFTTATMKSKNLRTKKKKLKSGKYILKNKGKL